MDALYVFSFPYGGREQSLIRERCQLLVTEKQIDAALGVHLSADPNYRSFYARSAKPGECTYTMPLGAGTHLIIDKVE